MALAKIIFSVSLSNVVFMRLGIKFKVTESLNDNHKLNAKQYFSSELSNKNNHNVC